jgi:hypothetical protein
MRVRYTARRKRGLVAALNRMIAEGMTLRAAVEELCVSAANLSKWASQGMGEIDHLDKILRSKKKAALNGPSSQLKAIEDGLLRYIFEKCDQGVEVSTFTVVLRASFLSPEFREKSFTACCSCVKRFLHAILSRIEWARTRRSNLQPKFGDGDGDGERRWGRGSSLILCRHKYLCQKIN